MNPTIVVAVIMAVGTIVTQIVVSRGSRKAAEASQQAAMEVFNYRISDLEKKVTKHNNLVERLTICEQSTKSAHHRIDELREEK